MMPASTTATKITALPIPTAGCGQATDKAWFGSLIHAGGLQRYGLGQYWMDPGDAFDPSVAAHLRNGVPEPPGTPMTNRGPPIEWGLPFGQPAPR
jgi:hypothetical protein